jgi:hypothetical protein
MLVMLVVLFAALFTPIALVFRLMGRDALAIKRRAATTYWIRKASPSSSSEYLREY